MVVEYVCPLCGRQIIVKIVATYPPITCYQCPCGYHHDERDTIERRVAPMSERIELLGEY